MAYCISITDTEHLPIEETLLVHYVITCTGNWGLVQLLTAYRNVCDDMWTVMYPNHQHPRHTDLPVNVTYAGFKGTFAWNYGGIQGIDPEDFDENHSFLTQLCIYETNACKPTGPTGFSGIPTGVESGKKGRPGFTGWNDPPPWNKPRPGIAKPVGGPGIPWPGIPNPGIPPWSGKTGIITGVDPDPPPPGLPDIPDKPVLPPHIPVRPDPDTRPPGHTYGRASEAGMSEGRPEILDPGSLYEGSIVDQMNFWSRTMRPVDKLKKPAIGEGDGFGDGGGGAGGDGPNNFPGGENLIAGEGPGSWESINQGGWDSFGDTSKKRGNSIQDLSQLFTPQTGTYMNRDTKVKAGDTPESAIDFDAAPSTAIPYDLAQPAGSPTSSTDGQIDLRSDGASDRGLVGTVGGSSFGSLRPSADATSLNQVDTESLIPGAQTVVETMRDSLPMGERMVVSATFIPPVSIEIHAYSRLYAIDKGNAYLLGSKPATLTNNVVPLKISGLYRTDAFGPGLVTLTYVVYDQDDKVIGVDSKSIHVTSTESKNFSKNLLEAQRSHVDVLGDDIPTALRNVLNLQHVWIPVTLKPKGVFSILLNRVGGAPQDFSALFVSEKSYDDPIEARILIVNTDQAAPLAEFDTSTYGDSDLAFGSFPGVVVVHTTPLAKSDTRMILDGEPFLPESHITALPVSSVATDNITLMLSPIGENLNQNIVGRLYISNNYKVQPSLNSTLIGTSDTAFNVNVITPYPLQEIKYFVNGPDLDTIPSSRTEFSLTTDYTGRATGTLATGEGGFGEYFTFVHEGNGTFNPYTDSFATFQLPPETATTGSWVPPEPGLGGGGVPG